MRVICGLLVWLLLVCLLRSPAPASAQIPALTGSADYWDMGLRLSYPQGWKAPAIIAGQMLFAPDPAEALRGSMVGPVIVLRIVDPVSEMGMPKHATFQEIAIAFNLNDKRLEVPNSGDASVAGMTAGFADLRDNERGLRGQSIAFMLPDGRYGLLLCLTPQTMWADFVPTFDKMRASAHILRPADYPAPVMGTVRVQQFVAGGLHWHVPQGWETRDLSTSGQIGHAADGVEYADSSGFVNGPQLVLRAVSFATLNQTATPPTTPTQAGQPDLRAALVTLLGATPAQAQRFKDVTLGAGLRAVQYETEHADTGQRVTFIGLSTREGSTFTVLRLTRPGSLVDVTRPLFDAILASVALN